MFAVTPAVFGHEKGKHELALNRDRKIPGRLICKEISDSLKLSVGCVSLRCMLHIHVIEKGNLLGPELKREFKTLCPKSQHVKNANRSERLNWLSQ